MESRVFYKFATVNYTIRQESGVISLYKILDNDTRLLVIDDRTGVNGVIGKVPLDEIKEELKDLPNMLLYKMEDLNYNELTY